MIPPSAFFTGCHPGEREKEKNKFFFFVFLVISDSESAAAPSLGRRVWTEASPGDNAAALSPEEEPLGNLLSYPTFFFQFASSYEGDAYKEVDVNNTNVYACIY